MLQGEKKNVLFEPFQVSFVRCFTDLATTLELKPWTELSHVYLLLFLINVLHHLHVLLLLLSPIFSAG